MAQALHMIKPPYTLPSYADLNAPGTALHALNKLRGCLPAPVFMGAWHVVHSAFEAYRHNNINIPANVNEIIQPNSNRVTASQKAMLAPVGWTRPTGGPIRLTKLSVKSATDLLLSLQEQTEWRGNEERRQMRLNGNVQPVKGRRDRLLQYVALAEGTENCYQSAENADAATKAVCSMLRRAHRIRWNNKYKGPLWRLVYNGLPTAARLHKDDPCGCCGTDRPDIKHHFWDCPAVQNLVARINTLTNAQITRDNIWLARPMAGISSSVWSVVCVAVVAALDSARKLAYVYTHPKKSSTPIPPFAERQQLITRHVITYFWELLADYVTVHPSPPWVKDIPPTHPLISSLDYSTLRVVPPPT